MKFKYVGDGDGMEMFGYSFNDGATPDVKEDFFIKKLSGNSFFEATVKNEKQTTKMAANQDDKTEMPALI